MKSEISLKDKLKICFNFIFGDRFRDSLIEICPKCGSTNITKTHHWEKQMEKGSEYHAAYKCKKCGSESSVREDWYY